MLSFSQTLESVFYFMTGFYLFSYSFSKLINFHYSLEDQFLLLLGFVTWILHFSILLVLVWYGLRIIKIYANIQGKEQEKEKLCICKVTFSPPDEEKWIKPEGQGLFSKQTSHLTLCINNQSLDGSRLGHNRPPSLSDFTLNS